MPAYYKARDLDDVHTVFNGLFRRPKRNPKRVEGGSIRMAVLFSVVAVIATITLFATLASLVVDAPSPGKQTRLRFTSSACVLTSDGVVFSGHIDRGTVAAHVDEFGGEPVPFTVTVRREGGFVAGRANGEIHFESTPDGTAPVSVWVLTSAPPVTDPPCHGTIRG